MLESNVYTIVIRSSTQHLRCSSCSPLSTLTHDGNANKSAVAMDYTLPDGLAVDAVELVYSVVQSTPIFWAVQRADKDLEIGGPKASGGGGGECVEQEEGQRES